MIAKEAIVYIYTDMPLASLLFNSIRDTFELITGSYLRYLIVSSNEA